MPCKKERQTDSRILAALPITTVNIRRDVFLPAESVSPPFKEIPLE